MNDFLGLKEAALFSGRSESTLKRLIIKVLEENKHDQSVIDQIIKKRPAAKGYFFDHKSGRTVHRQSYGRITRDSHFTPRRLSDCIPFSERTLGVKDLGKEAKRPVIMKPEPVETPEQPAAA